MRYLYLCLAILMGLLAGCGSPVAARPDVAMVSVASPAEVAATAVPSGLISVVLFDEPE